MGGAGRETTPGTYSNQTREVLHHCLSTPQFIRRILIDFDGAAGLDKLLGRGTGGCKISQGQVKKNALKKKNGGGETAKKKTAHTTKTNLQGQNSAERDK